MKIGILTIAAFLILSVSWKTEAQEFDGANCTSIMVGKNASTDGSVMTSHTCDGQYRTWMRWEKAQDFEKTLK